MAFFLRCPSCHGGLEETWKERTAVIDRHLRRVKDALLHPFALRARGLHPVTVTWVGFVLGIAAAASAAAGLNGWALGLWIANRACDGLDGAIARVHQRKSDWGGYLDLVLDLTVYAALPIGVAFARTDAWLAAAVLLGSFYVNLGTWTLLSALAPDHERDTTVTMPVGLVEGAETAAFYSAFLLWPAWAPALFWIMAALVLATAAQRTLWASRYLRRTP